MPPNDRIHYFAYGSNMSRRRLAARVPDPVALGAASLDGMRLACNKPGRDGSGKANIVPDAGGRVWGVIYRLRATDLDALDGFEPGYTRELHRVLQPDGSGCEVHIYRWLPPTGEAPPARPLAPTDWYRDLILEGAREHDLPLPYRRLIENWELSPSAAVRKGTDSG